LSHPLLLLPPQYQLSLPLLVENHLRPLPLHPLRGSPLLRLPLKPLPLQHQLVLLLTPLAVSSLLLQLQLVLPLAPQPLLLLLKQLLLLQLFSLSLPLLQLQMLPLLLLLERVDLLVVVGERRLALHVVKLWLKRDLGLGAELLEGGTHVRLRAELLLCELLCGAEHVMVRARPSPTLPGLLLLLYVGCCWAAGLLLVQLGLGDRGHGHARRQRCKWVGQRWDRLNSGSADSSSSLVLLGLDCDRFTTRGLERYWRARRGLDCEGRGALLLLLDNRALWFWRLLEAFLDRDPRRQLL